MIKFELNNNNILNFVPFKGTKPLFAFPPSDEMGQWTKRAHDYDGINSVTSTESVDAVTDVIAAANQGYNIPMENKYSKPNHFGVINHTVPCLINQDKADFKYFYLDLNSDLSQYSNPSNIESWLSDFYESNDNFKVATLFTGLQFLKIPIDKFEDIYGNYYIKVSPKYIETTITNLIPRVQIPLIGNVGTQTSPYREVIQVDKLPFNGTIWNFDSLTNLMQRGRLLGSVVEIWDSSKQILKQTKLITEDDVYNNNSSSIAKLILSPDTIGFDAPSEVATIGDVLKIYPRESYFNPLFFEISYQKNEDNLQNFVKYMKNDASRDLTNNIIEIFDDAGITIDGNGNVNGNVIMSYQIIKVGNKEVRIKINNG